MIGCEHYTTLIQSRHSSNGEETVAICRRCGEIQVSATKQGVHFSTTFHLVNDDLLIAASQAYRLANDRDAKDVLGKTISKPLDFGRLRLYQVRLYWCLKDQKGEGTEYFVVAADSPNQTPHSAANQIRDLYKEAYDSNPDILYWAAKGYALNVLQPLSWSENGIRLLERSFFECFVPGEYRCPKCGERMTDKSVREQVQQDMVAAEDYPTCPRDGTKMDLVTWRQAAEDAGRMAHRDANRVAQLEREWPEGYPLPALQNSDMIVATDYDPISACCAGNTGGPQHVGCIYIGCRCECHSQDGGSDELTNSETVN